MFWWFFVGDWRRRTRIYFSKFSPLMLSWNLSDATALSTLSQTRKISTITEQTLTTMPSHSDFHSFQNDGEYFGSMSKQYHSGERDLENDVGDEDFHRNPLDRGPFFEITATKNITAIAGHSAYLNCRVRNLGNRTVSLSFNYFLERSNVSSFLMEISAIFLIYYDKTALTLNLIYDTFHKYLKLTKVF